MGEVEWRGVWNFGSRTSDGEEGEAERDEGCFRGREGSMALCMGKSSNV